MTNLESDMVSHRRPRTIWSHGAGRFVPERFRRIITVIMPVIYLLLLVFGVCASIYPVPTFQEIVGPLDGIIWAILVSISALLSLVCLIFRCRFEIYSSIILSGLLFVYPFYVTYLVIHDSAQSGDFSRLGVIFAVAIYPIMPAWRSIDIVLEIRKSTQRRLFAEQTLGEVKHNDAPNSGSTN